MTPEQQRVLSQAELVANGAKSLKIKVFKFDKGELHPTIAAEYNRERLRMLSQVAQIEKEARKHGIMHGFYRTKQMLWSLLCSIKYRMSEL